MWRSISGLFGYENDVSVEPNSEIFGGTESQNKMKTRRKKFFFLLSKSLESNKQRLHRGIITVHHINTGFLRRLLLPLDDKVVKNPRRYWNCQRNSQRSTVGLTLGSRNDCSRFSSSSALLDASPIPDCCLKSVSLRCCQKKAPVACPFSCASRALCLNIKNKLMKRSAVVLSCGYFGAAIQSTLT